MMSSKQLQRLLRLHSSLAGGSERWDIFAAIALIRPPITAPPMNNIEKQYQKLMIEKELENSLYCDFELRQLRDERLLKEREKLKISGEGGNLKEELGILASVDEERWRKEADQIIQQICTKDRSKYLKADSHSLQKETDEPVVLVVRQKFGRTDGYNSPWHLPQLRNQTGESLKQTSKRCLRELFVNDIPITGLSNAPFSVYTYRYAARLRERLETTSHGGVIFFFKALYAERTALLPNKEETGDFKWVSAKEFAEINFSKPYFRSLSTLFPSYQLTINRFENCKYRKSVQMKR